MSGLNPTIAALSTPPGEGAIALIRMSGPDTSSVLEGIFRSSRPPAPRQATLGRIVNREGATIDQVVVTTYPGPASYTGEDVAEIGCHGGILNAARVLQTVLSAGAAGAGPGEFTQRAFLNGKLDLTQAEAVMDLIRAQTPRAAAAAAEQLEGRIGAATNQIRDAIVEITAHVEAFIDFPEEGIDPDTGELLLTKLDEARTQITDLLATADEGRVLREGVRLAICGRPNAGKSSLLNRLLGFERAIVSPTAGTTRDTIEESISLRGIPFRVVDTAGLRDTDDSVEREGVDRARRAIDRADLVVRVVDGASGEGVSDPPATEEEFVVLNKSDVGSDHGDTGGHRISCVTGAGVDDLVDQLVARVAPTHESGSLAAINARHQACLTLAADSLAAAAEALRTGTEPEFISLDLHAALDAVGNVVGRVDSEDILGKIFSSFCIGK
ncbi:MAG: tRNA uridine-5-carboxymethylaminomethyl(34) synthesis GTPase MnmE [Chthoniobacterales bacterium]